MSDTAPRLWHACSHCGEPLRLHVADRRDCRVTLRPCDVSLRANWPDFFAESFARPDGVACCPDCLRPIRDHLEFAPLSVEILGTVITAGAGMECCWELPVEWSECGVAP